MPLNLFVGEPPAENDEAGYPGGQSSLSEKQDLVYFGVQTPSRAPFICAPWWNLGAIEIWHWIKGFLKPFLMLIPNSAMLSALKVCCREQWSPHLPLPRVNDAGPGWVCSALLASGQYFRGVNSVLGIRRRD